MGADCKSAGYAYVGSNPTRPTTSLHSSAVEHSLGKGEVTSSILVEGFWEMNSCSQLSVKMNPRILILDTVLWIASWKVGVKCLKFGTT